MLLLLLLLFFFVGIIDQICASALLLIQCDVVWRMHPSYNPHLFTLFFCFSLFGGGLSIVNQVNLVNQDFNAEWLWKIMPAYHKRNKFVSHAITLRFGKKPKIPKWFVCTHMLTKRASFWAPSGPFRLNWFASTLHLPPPPDFVLFWGGNLRVNMRPQKCALSNPRCPAGFGPPLTRTWMQL